MFFSGFKQRWFGYALAGAFLLSVLIWAQLSLSFAFDGDAGNFQRLGSLVVASAILLISSNRYLVEQAFSATRDIKVTKEQMELPEFKEAMNSLGIPDEFWHASAEAGGISELGKKMSNGFMKAEVSFLILGTLQWGYGDLFVCWLNGNGWRACG